LSEIGQNKTFAPQNELTVTGLSRKRYRCTDSPDRHESHSFIAGAGITADIAAKEHPQISNLDMLRHMFVDCLICMTSAWFDVNQMGLFND